MLVEDNQVVQIDKIVQNSPVPVEFDDNSKDRSSVTETIQEINQVVPEDIGSLATDVQESVVRDIKIETHSSSPAIDIESVYKTVYVLGKTGEDITHAFDIPEHVTSESVALPQDLVEGSGAHFELATPAIEFIGLNYSIEDKNQLDKKLGVENLDIEQQNFSQIINQQIKNIDDYRLYNEAINAMEIVQELIDEISNEICERPDSMKDIVININDINHIDALRSEVSKVLEALGYDSEDAVIDRVIELLVKEKLSSKLSLDEHEFDDSRASDIGTHEVKLDQSVTQYFGNSSSTKQSVPYILGKFAIFRLFRLNVVSV